MMLPIEHLWTIVGVRDACSFEWGSSARRVKLWAWILFPDNAAEEEDAGGAAGAPLRAAVQPAQHGAPLHTLFI